MFIKTSGRQQHRSYSLRFLVASVFRECLTPSTFRAITTQPDPVRQNVIKPTIVVRSGIWAGNGKFVALQRFGIVRCAYLALWKCSAAGWDDDRNMSASRTDVQPDDLKILMLQLIIQFFQCSPFAILFKERAAIAYRRLKKMKTKARKIVLMCSVVLR